MSDAFRTTADILKVNNSEQFIGLVDSVLPSFPLINRLFASPIKGYTYKTLIRTALPTVSFRDDNTGVENTKGTYSNETVEAMYLDASWIMDKKVAAGCEWGVDAALAMEAQDHLQSAFVTAEKQIFYGTGADANGFNGITNTLDDLNETMCISAGGTAGGSTCTSVFAIKTGLKDCQLVWGYDGAFALGEILEQMIAGSVSGRYMAYTQEIAGYVGLQMGSAYSVGRLANINSTSKVDDDDLSELISLFPAAAKPDFLVMNRTSLKYLQQSRTATNNTGAPAPFPTEAFGYPIIVSDNILNTEAVVTAGS